MNEILARLSGLPEFQRALAQIGQRMGDRALRPAAAAGARLVRKAVKDAAPIGPYRVKHRGRGRTTPAGVLRRAALLKFARELSAPGQAGYIVTLRMGKRAQQANRDAFYWPWVEAGHRIVPRRGSAAGGNATLRARRSAARGGLRVPPHPFFGPAVESSAAQATRVMRERLAAELAKVIA